MGDDFDLELHVLDNISISVILNQNWTRSVRQRLYEIVCCTFISMQAWRHVGTARGAREPEADQVFADYQVLKQFLSARPISMNENRNRNRQLGIGKLYRLERRPTRATASISRLLSGEETNATVTQIQSFISGQNHEDTEDSCAKKIQRAWRRHLGRERLRKILSFVVKQGRKSKRVSYCIWRLAQLPTADVAKKFYTTVISNYFSSRAIVQSTNHVWLSRDGMNTVCTFDQFMKTGFLMISRRYDPATITRFVKLMSREMLRRFLDGWSTYAIDKATVSRQSKRVQVLLKMRQMFGPQFWCFHFWRNWSSFKHHKQFDMSLERHQYVPEWQMYRAAQQHKRKLIDIADKHYKVKVAIRAVDALHSSSLYELRIAKSYRRCLRIFSRKAGEKCIRALRHAAILRKFHDRIRKRILRSWYEAIDRQAMMRVTGECLKERVILSDMVKVLAKWRNHAFQRQVLNAFEHEHIRRHQLQALKAVFLMTNDKLHYRVGSCFSSWKKIIQMKDRARRFVNWNITKAREQAVYQYVLVMMKDAADQHINRLDYVPFNVEGEKLMMVSQRKKWNHCMRNKKWWMLLRNEIERNEITIAPPKNSTAVLLNAYRTVEDIEPCETSWAKTMSREDVRTLFFRLIVLLANKAKVPVHHRRVTKSRAEMVKQFQSERELWTPEAVSVLRSRQEEEARHARLLFMFRKQRDKEMLSALEAHEAALVMGSKLSHFSVCSSARPVTTTEPDLKPARQSIVIPMTKYNPIQSKHPLLQDPSTIKKQILDTNRKFRRNPENIFEKQVVVRAALTMDIPEKRKPQSSLQPLREYDAHQSITKSKELMTFVSSRSFVLSDLKRIQEKAKQEIIRLEREADADTLAKAPRTRKRQTISAPHNRSPRQGARICGLPFDFIVSPRVEPEPDVEEKPKVLDLTLERISTSFVDDPYYVRKERPDRVKVLFTKFFAMLNYFLNGADVAFKTPDLEKLQARIFFVIRKVVYPLKRYKKELPQPPPYQAPSLVPELPALVIGQIATDAETLSIGFRVFGLDRLREAVDAYLTPAKQMACVKETLCETESYCSSETNRSTIQDIVDKIAEQTLKEEAEIEEQKQLEEERKLSARKHRKTLLPKSLPTELQGETRVFEEPPKRRISPAVERKFDFAQDALGMIFESTTFVTNSVKLYYTDDADLDPFDGSDDLRLRLEQKSKAKPTVVEFGDDNEKKSPKKKKKKVTVTKVSVARKASPKKTQRASAKKAVNIVINNDIPPPVPMKQRRGRVSWAVDVMGTYGAILQNQNRPIADSDIDFFMFFAPHIIPCTLLIAMLDAVEKQASQKH